MIFCHVSRNGRTNTLGTNTSNPSKKRAVANVKNLRRIFTVPENKQSTLSKIEATISANIQGFLKENIVASPMDIQKISEKFVGFKVPDEPTFVSDHADFLMNSVIPDSVHLSAPKYIGHMTSALPYFMMPLAKVLIALNQNVVKIETSKVFTPLERQTLAMLHHLVFDQSDAFYKKNMHEPEAALGLFCSGGTIANLTGLWLARDRLLGRDQENTVDKVGLPRSMQEHGYKDLAVIVSDKGHYSIAKSMHILGLGSQSVSSVPTDNEHHIDLSALEKRIQKLQADGVGIVACIGIAGTTESGACDNLVALADLCEKYPQNGESIHLHVDGAWGAPTLFSNKYKHKLTGIERARTVVMDAHKQLYAPMGAGVLLCREPKDVKAIQHSAQYIIRKGSHDLGKFSLEGSRPGMSMLLHSALHIMGKAGYEFLVDDGIARTASFARMINEHPAFELICKPELNIITYRYLPKHCRIDPLKDGDQQKINRLQISLQKKQRSMGRSFVSRTKFYVEKYQTELVVLRAVLANPLTKEKDLEEILKEQEEYGNDFL